MDILSISDLGTFENIVKKLKSLIQEYKCSIDVRYPFFADFDIEKSALEEQDARVIAREIEPLLTFLLSESKKENERLKNFIPIDDKQLTEEVINEFWKKSEIVSSYFYTKELKELKEIRQSTKNMILTNINWEINKKLYTSDNDKKKSLKYTTLQFEFQEQRDYGGPFFFKGPNPFVKLKKINFDLHEINIDNLIQMLHKIKAELKEEGTL